MEIEVTDSNYKEVAATDNLLVLDFWASWCGPCLALGPTIAAIAKDYEGKGVTVGKVNADENEDLCSVFGIRNLPTILYIKNGEVVDKTVGAMPKNMLVEKINGLL
ncbi:MAG: thioredoxin [Paludibacteraceae bacterium]|nr:thioredoxin [Paludibacteraceae bacterium]MBR6041063.1 thioredoxin [Paludibacteraceae bacterium]MCR5570251.1 thioredoxin [Paludibacteraceae bacterium]